MNDIEACLLRRQGLPKYVTELRPRPPWARGVFSREELDIAHREGDAAAIAAHDRRCELALMRDTDEAAREREGTSCDEGAGR